MFDDPHLAASGALEAVTLPDGRETHLPALPIAFDGVLAARSATLPLPEADTAELLGTLGYSEAEIGTMMA